LKSIISSFINAIKHLTVVRSLPRYFDEEERRLVFQSAVIGVVVWAVVFALKTAVHLLFETLIHWLEAAPTPLLVFVPLLIGAVATAAIVRYRASVIHYRDKEGHIHELIDAEGDGLERAIALYYTSEPAFEQILTGQEGVEVRWQMPTFTLAARKFLATLTTLGSGGSGGLEASVTLIGESLSAGMFKPRQLLNGNRLPKGVTGRLSSWWQANDPDHLQTAQLSGIAAAVAVLLGAPFAAAFFATEVMYRKRPIIEKLVYSLI
jgi:H+/Cl- antiporter ClcA